MAAPLAEEEAMTNRAGGEGGLVRFEKKWLRQSVGREVVPDLLFEWSGHGPSPDPKRWVGVSNK